QPYSAGLARAFEQRLPTLGELGDRLDRDRVLRRARNVAEPGCRADIERHDIVADWRMTFAQDMALGEVEPDRLVMDQPRPGETRQPPQIDMAFLEAVVSGDIPRQHAGIGGLDIARDQCDAHARFRPHAEALQHMHMRMPAADEHQIPVYGGRGLHRPALCPTGPPSAISYGAVFRIRTPSRLCRRLR